MKNKEEVTMQGKPVFYAVLYNSMREAALKCGYALALHGSMHSDMDLIAVAWEENAKPVKVLVNAINDCLGNTVWKKWKWRKSFKKPHGRLSHTISICGDWFIDLSVIPPNKKSI